MKMVDRSWNSDYKKGIALETLGIGRDLQRRVLQFFGADLFRPILMVPQRLNTPF